MNDAKATDPLSSLNARVSIDRSRVDRFCHKWKINELALFGSILRQDFRDDSDVDILVTFAPDAQWSLLDHAAMREDLEQILGRKVDLVGRRAIESSSNWIRRQNILESAQLYYAAG